MGRTCHSSIYLTKFDMKVTLLLRIYSHSIWQSKVVMECCYIYIRYNTYMEKKKESSFDYVCCAVSDGGFFPQLRSADTVIDYFSPPPTSFSLVFLLLCYVTNCTYIFYIWIESPKSIMILQTDDDGSFGILNIITSTELKEETPRRRGWTAGQKNDGVQLFYLLKIGWW